MDKTRLSVTLEGSDSANAGLQLQELRKRILNAIPNGVDVSLEKSDPESMQFWENILIDILTAGTVHTLFEILVHYRRPPGSVLRIVAGDKVAVLSDVTPDPTAELNKLIDPDVK